MLSVYGLTSIKAGSLISVSEYKRLSSFWACFLSATDRLHFVDSLVMYTWVTEEERIHKHAGLSFNVFSYTSIAQIIFYAPLGSLSSFSVIKRVPLKPVLGGAADVAH